MWAGCAISRKYFRNQLTPQWQNLDFTMQQPCSVGHIYDVTRLSNAIFDRSKITRGRNCLWSPDAVYHIPCIPAPQNQGRIVLEQSSNVFVSLFNRLQYPVLHKKTILSVPHSYCLINSKILRIHSNTRDYFLIEIQTLLNNLRTAFFVEWCGLLLQLLVECFSTTAKPLPKLAQYGHTYIQSCTWNLKIIVMLIPVHTTEFSWYIIGNMLTLCNVVNIVIILRKMFTCVILFLRDDQYTAWTWAEVIGAGPPHSIHGMTICAMRF